MGAGLDPAAGGASADRRRIWLQSLALIVAAGFVFSPAVTGGWLWDDDVEVTNNAALRDGSGLLQFWTGAAGHDYLPLKSSVQWIEWHLWQAWAPGYRLANIAFHLLSALLLWRLLTKLGLRMAWLGGLLFALHPLSVESVGWVSELKNTLSLPPLLLAIAAYVDFERGRASFVAGVADPGSRPQRGRLQRGLIPFKSLSWFVVACLCKDSVVMFPVVLLAYEVWRRGRLTADGWRRAAPFFAASIVFSAVTVWFQYKRAIAGTEIPIGNLAARFARAGIAEVFYLSKAALPFRLLPIYPRWPLSPLAPGALAWCVVAAVAAWLLAARTPWRRHALFGLAVFGASLVPVLGFLPISFLRITWVSDHFTYVALPAAAALGAAAVGGLRAPSARIAAAAALCLLFAWLSFGYDGIFRSQEAMWTYEIARDPDAWLAHNNLGNAYRGQGRLADAEREYREALRCLPDYAEAHNNLGDALLDGGRAAEAIQQFREALRIYPDYAMANNGWGVALLRTGHPEAASAQFRQALRLLPDYAEAHENLGIALANTSRWPEAVAQYEAALAINPGLYEAENNIGTAFVSQGRFAEAIPHFEAAVRLKSDYADAENDLGYALAKTGHPAEAIPHFERALQLAPGSIVAHFNFADALRAVGRGPEAEVETARARALLAAARPGGVAPR